MPELGRIKPVKKALCPHCSKILPADYNTNNNKNVKCPYCGKTINCRIKNSNTETSASINKLPGMSMSAQILKLQVQHKDKEKD
ncbi:MAG: hypothetical protein M1536_07525 [Firmicutes bacterium]|nr:hypothetical protein [Bacillota bacterium]